MLPDSTPSKHSGLNRVKPLAASLSFLDKLTKARYNEKDVQNFGDKEVENATR